MARFSLYPQQEGAGLPAPSSGASYYFHLLKTYIWNMILLNVVFVVCCIPIVTIPCALTAMNRVYVKMIDQGYLLFWEEFKGEWKASWKKSMLAGIPFHLMFFVSYYLLSLSLSNGNNLFALITGVLGLVVLIILVMYSGFTFILMAVQDLPTRQIKHNARFMMVLCLKQCAGFAAFLFLWVSLAVISPWIFLALFLLGGFAVMQFTMCWWLFGPIRKYVLKPEAKDEAPADDDE